MAIDCGFLFPFRNPDFARRPWVDVYRDDLALAVHTEALGFDHVWLTEHHFVDDGYFEGRQPFDIRVNERWYLTENVGVADFVRQGKLESGQQHFDENGYKEGRLPFPL